MITDPKIEQYMHELLPARNSTLVEMEAYALNRHFDENLDINLGNSLLSKSNVTCVL